MEGAARLGEDHTHGRPWKIEYQYNGDSPLLTGAVCEDDFYDKGRRRVIVEAADR